MIRLDSNIRSLQFKTDVAVTANELKIVVSYSDKTSSQYLGGTQVTTSTGTTILNICDPPGTDLTGSASYVRDIDTITIMNLDTVSATVYVYFNDDGTLYTIINCGLTTGDHLEYTHGEGWKTIDSAGNTKTTSGGGSVVPAALSKTDDTNVTLTLGGTPLTALLQAVSLTLGWTGLLSLARGGTGSGTAAGARTNLGLGNSATLDVGTTAGTVAAGDDSRFTDPSITEALFKQNTTTTHTGTTSATVIASYTIPISFNEANDFWRIWAMFGLDIGGGGAGNNQIRLYVGPNPADIIGATHVGTINGTSTLRTFPGGRTFAFKNSLTDFEGSATASDFVQNEYTNSAGTPATYTIDFSSQQYLHIVVILANVGNIMYLRSLYSNLIR